MFHRADVEPGQRKNLLWPHFVAVKLIALRHAQFFTQRAASLVPASRSSRATMQKLSSASKSAILPDQSPPA